MEACRARAEGSKEKMMNERPSTNRKLTRSEKLHVFITALNGTLNDMSGGLFKWVALFFALWMINQANDTFGSIECLKAGGRFDPMQVNSLCLPVVKP